MNRKFNPNVWDTSIRPVHSIPPFANNQQNFYPPQFPQQFPTFNQNFQQQNPNLNIRPLLSTDHPPPNFNRKFNNNNNLHNPDYRRPGPAFTRNNNYQGNNHQKWNKNNQRDDFNNRDHRPNENIFESHNNNRPGRSDQPNEPPPPVDCNDVPKFKSLVEHLKAVQNSRKNDVDGSRSELDAICIKNASEAPRKLLTQLKTMNKDGVKDLINNPKQPYKKKVLNIQAREKLRIEMRKKLKILGTEGDGSDYLEPDECIDYDKIPETLIAQIDKTMDMELGIEDMDLSESMVEEIIEDKDIEVVKQNLGNDFLMGSEMLLMNGFSLLAETDNEGDMKLDEGLRMPPLPLEPNEKPPSPPPEPVKPPEDKAAFSSVEKPWSPVRNMRQHFADDDWDIESAKNPDPPNLANAINLPVPTPPLVLTSFETQRQAFETPKSSFETPKTTFDKTMAEENKKPSMQTEDDEWDNVISATKPPAVATTADSIKVEASAESGQRANETYGQYRKRLADENRKENKDQNKDDEGGNTPSISSNNSFNHNNNKPQRDFNRFQPRNQQKSNDREDDWTTNNRRTNNQNKLKQQPNRQSRFEMDRGRDRNNRFQQRNLSRDTNNSYDSGRQDKFDDVKDVHNYRFQNENNSAEPDLNRLNTLLHPKPLQFKGSFNKRAQVGGRNRTPGDSMDREFDESLLPSASDVRPCFTTLKKVMEIDAEIARVHEKIHGIDKVISNLQSERCGYQRTFSNLQHDRKILFENMMKRASLHQTPEKEKSTPRDPPPTSQKSQNEKKLQNIVDQKKRKHDETPEEPKKKKPAVEVVETTSAAAKAAQIHKEREEEERRLKKRRIKQERKEREEAEKSRLEEKIRREAAAATMVTVKQEPRDKSVEKSKSKNHHQSSGNTHKGKEAPKIIFKSSEVIKTEGYEIKTLDIRLRKVPIAQALIDSFKSSGRLEVNLNDWNSWSKSVMSKDKVKKEDEKPAKDKSPEADTDPLEIIENIIDPLAVDECSMNPPTPGSNLTSNEDSMLVEIQTEQDYSEWTGNFTAHDAPIVHLSNINGKYVVAASEDGKVFKYFLSDGKLAAVFSKHTEICNSFLYDDRGSIYTVSSDGFLHKIKFKNFQLVASENFDEPLQVIEKSKVGIYVGTKSGRIYRLKLDLTEREPDPICDLGALILCMRAAKEGSRHILLVSSRTHAIQVRDAKDGLLLRTLSDNLAGVSIYDMLIEGSTIYCGSNRHEIFAIDFTTGALKKSRPCGAGAICVKLFKHYLIAACYDGNIYIFNTKNDDDAVNICGPSNMLLSMDLWNDKIIASTKDKTVKIMNIPT